MFKSCCRQEAMCGELYHLTEFRAGFRRSFRRVATNFSVSRNRDNARTVSSTHGAKAQRQMEGNMSDPLNTGPRYSYSKFSESVGRRSDSVVGTWGWIAGIAVIALIAIFLIVGGKGVSDNTASNTPPASTTGSAPVRNVTPGPSTTGMGTPLQPRPTPAPATTPPASGNSQ
jgi:hypothetical protein